MQMTRLSVKASGAILVIVRGMNTATACIKASITCRESILD
jgi:hypothetical protein